MARFLRQSTAATVKVGPLVATADAVTPYADGGFTAKLSKAGGALAARHDATPPAHDADGYYSVALDATDTDTLGRLRLAVPGSAGSYLPAWEDYAVLSPAVYDSLFGAAALSTYAGGPVASVTAAVQAVLTADGLDAIPVTAPAGPPATFRQMAVMTYRRLFKKAVRNADAGTLVCYDDDGTTPITTQVVTDDGAGNESQGAAT